MDEGKRDKRKAKTDKEAMQPLGKEFGKTTIMPITVPSIGNSHPSSTHGVAFILHQGKTSIAVALMDLFWFGHTQSNNVKAKKPAPVFIQNVKKLLRDHDVVIANK
jgi:tRNA ligase